MAGLDVTIPRLVGLTGGIACGKSTVAGFFCNLGVPVLDADKIARDVVEPNTAGYEEVVRAFGADILQPDGVIDRKKLADIVFQSPESRLQLNAILHPRIIEESEKRRSAFAASMVPYVVYEAALLIENQALARFDAIVLVAADPAHQYLRLRTRDGFDESAARARIASQLPLEEKIQAADFVIWNNGSLEETRQQVVQVHHELIQRLQSE